jgi:hypothetical protein
MKKIYTRITAVALMVMLVAVAAMGQKTIAFIISAADYESIDNQSEIDINDSLLSWGFTVDIWSSASIQNGDMMSFYPDYDGIVISEWVGSSSVNHIGEDGYLVPVVCMEGYAPRDERWNWISDNTTQFIQASGDAPQTIVIQDNSHYITEIYNQGDEIDWSDPVGAGITESMGVCSWAEDKVTYSHKLAKNKSHITEYPDFWHMVAIDEDILPNKVFMWGMIGTGLDNDALDVHGGTVDFYAILHRACQWAFDDMPAVGVEKEVASPTFELAVFPNPAAGRVIFRFESPVYGPAVATLYNVTGQQVDVYRQDAISGKNFIEMDVADLAQGVYQVGLELNGRLEFVKLVVQ